MATVSVWWIGWQAIGVGHSSFDIGNTYVTWLGDSGGGSSLFASSSRSSASSEPSSSSASNVVNTLHAGTYTMLSDFGIFGAAAETHDIAEPGGAAAPFGLVDSARLRTWWQNFRQTTRHYRAVSTEYNCNAVVMMGLKMAGATLFCDPPTFDVYAGANKIRTFATDLNIRITALNALYNRADVAFPGPGDGAEPPTAAQWDLDPLRVEFGPDVRADLQQYEHANKSRDALDALSRVLDRILQRIAAGRSLAPPPRAGQVAPLGILPGGAGAAVPIAHIRTFGRRVRDTMARIQTFHTDHTSEKSIRNGM